MNAQTSSPRKKGINQTIIGSLCVFLLFLSVGCQPSLEDEDWQVRRAAVRKLTDQALLAQVAIEDKKDFVRAEAVGRLTDQALLEQVAAEVEHDYTQLLVLRRLTDHQLMLEPLGRKGGA